LLFQAERYRTKVTELERTVDRLTSELNASEAKRKEAENHLMTEDTAWKLERTAFEERLKKVTDIAGFDKHEALFNFVFQ
jgi:regulator of replication initiation timing